jgi:endonuclease/exonuclease/phosphatase family metal-dependent hydrolase
MPINVISWNIKGFVSCVGGGGNHRTVIEEVMNTFDLIFIYEVPNTVNGRNSLVTLRNRLNGLGMRNYAGVSVPTLGQGNENDRIGVLYETTIVAVADQTAARRPTELDGRVPAYFDVTELATGNTVEFCAWHAPEPTNAPQLIAQGWQSILHNTMDQNRNNVTAVVLGDFNNGGLRLPRRGAGRQLARQTNANVGTTLQAANTSNLATTLAYRTTNSYDQIYTDAGLLTAIGAVGTYDVMGRLVNDAAPFTGLFGALYNTPQKAYQFYNIRLSDHLPVAINLTL